MKYQSTHVIYIDVNAEQNSFTGFISSATRLNKIHGSKLQMCLHIENKLRPV